MHSIKLSLFYGLGLVLFGPGCGKSEFTSPGMKRSENSEAATPTPTSTVPPDVKPPDDPCEEKGRDLDDSKADRKILFYAPADANGGSQYYLDIKSALESENFDVKISNTIKGSIDDFDECNLFANFKQIWLFLPCMDSSVTQSMDEESIFAMTKFYQYGGGLFVMPDGHYDNDGSLHCDLSNYANSIDLSAISNILSVKFEMGAGMPFSTVVSEHPLKQFRKNIFDSWPTVVKGIGEASLISLDNNAKSGVIEKKLLNSRLSLALILSSAYNYHGLNAMGGGSGTNAAAPFVEIAKYFEDNLRKTTFSALKTYSLVKEEKMLKEKIRKKEMMEDMASSLNSESVSLVMTGLRDGVENAVIDFKTLEGYFSHQRYMVRLSAAELMAKLPNRERNEAEILKKLAQEDLSHREFLGFVRALAFMRATNALPTLKRLNPKLTSEQDELDAVIASIEDPK